jgi:hypothetical protein
LSKWGPFDLFVPDDCCNKCSKESIDTCFRLNIDINQLDTNNTKCCVKPNKVLNHTGNQSTLSFEGINWQDSDFYLNPDSTIAVGKNHIIQTAGVEIVIFAKSGKRLSTFKTYELFGYGSFMDEVTTVLYDTYSDRFVIASNYLRDNCGTKKGQIAFAIAKGPNPVSDGWYRYILPLDNEFIPVEVTAGYVLKLGSWHNGIYLSADCLDVTGGQREEYLRFSRLAIINRETILNGCPIQGLYHDVSAFGYIVNGWEGRPQGIMPPNANVSLPPLCENGYFINFPRHVTDFFIPRPGVIVFFECKVNWHRCSGKIRRIDIYPDCFMIASGLVDQKDTTVKLVSAGNSGNQTQAQYSHIDGNSSYWVSTTNASPSGLIWFEIRASDCKIPKIVQQETLENDVGFSKFNSSMAINKAGNVVLASTISSSDQFPSTIYYFRYNTDCKNAMTDNRYIITGEGSSAPGFSPIGWSGNSVQVDPTDATTFFICGMYYKTTTGREFYTKIVNLKL